MSIVEVIGESGYVETELFVYYWCMIFYFFFLFVGDSYCSIV